MSTRRIEWVVFDLGETLASETRNWTRWADHLGVPTFTFFGAIGAVIAQRRPHTEVFELFKPGFDWKAELALKDAAGEAWHVDVEDLYEDALDAIHRLRADGYKVAVIANQPRVVEGFLATLPIDASATSAAWGIEKPDVRFFERIADVLDAPAASIVYVGDRVDNDIVPAKKAGMAAIHIRRGPHGVIQADWPEAAQADAHITSLTDLPDALTALNHTTR